MKRRAAALSMLAGVLLVGCATIPKGPSVMVLPGTGKTFEQFQADDAVCRQWATSQVGDPAKAGARSTVTGAAIGTLVGAAAGAAIGAAAGSPATGAAVGAGIGVTGGTIGGASAGYEAGGSAQRRYDQTYMQCMYSKGNQIPVARGSLSGYSQQPPVPPPGAAPSATPPPPAGTPPPPPPGPTR